MSSHEGGRDDYERLRLDAPTAPVLTGVRVRIVDDEGGCPGRGWSSCSPAMRRRARECGPHTSSRRLVLPCRTRRIRFHRSSSSWTSVCLNEDGYAFDPEDPFPAARAWRTNSGWRRSRAMPYSRSHRYRALSAGYQLQCRQADRSARHRQRHCARRGTAIAPVRQSADHEPRAR